MRLGQGCRGRSPWWCWAVMLLAAAAVLPGAARIAESSRASEKPNRVEKPSRDREGAESIAEPKPCQRSVPTAAYQTIAPAAPDMASPPLGQASPKKPNRDRKGAIPPASLSCTGSSPQVTCEFMVADLVKAMQEEYNLDEAGARKALEPFLANAALGWGYGPSPLPAREHIDLTWSGNRVAMRAPLEASRRVSEAIDTMRRYGLSQVVMDVRFVTAPSSAVDAAGVDWKSQFEAVLPEKAAKLPHPVDVEFAAQDKRATHHDHSRTVREKSYPIRIAMLDEKDVSRLTARLDELESRQYQERETFGERVQQALGYQTRLAAGRQRVNILQAPRATLFSGQEGCVNDCSQSPFVVDLKTVTGPYGTANQPVIRVLDEGVKLNLRAVSLNNGCVRLECRARFSHIGEVNTLTTKPTVGSEPVTIQVPEHEVTELTTNVQVAVGQTVVIDGPRRNGKDGRLVSSLVMVTATKVIPAKTSPEKVAVAKAGQKTPPSVSSIDEADRLKAKECDSWQEYRERRAALKRQSQVAQRGKPIPPAEPRQDSDSQQSYYAHAYAVADLVVPIPEFVPNSQCIGVAYTEAITRKDLNPDFQPLVELIQSTVRPDTWEDLGGLGTIKPNEHRLTLVINQTKEVHEEIVDLFEQLRRLQDIQVSFEVRRIDMAGDTFDKLGIELDAKHRQTTLGPREARLFWALANSAGQGRVLQFPRVTCFNGQQARFGLAENPTPDGASDSMLLVDGIVDRQSRAGVRLTAGFHWVTEESRIVWDGFPSTTLPDGQTLLVDVTGLTPAKPLLDGEVGIPVKPGSKIFKSVKPDTSAQRVFLSITPKIIVAQEEEEPVDAKPGPKPAKASDADLGMVGMVKPRIIIQEKEEERIVGGVKL